MDTNGNKETMKKGFIYSIRSFKTDKIYIGSTFQRLSKRLYCHRCNYKYYTQGKKQPYCSSIEILKHGDEYIELIKEVQVRNRLELNKYEGIEQRNNINILVNKKIENRTPEENKQVKKNNSQRTIECEICNNIVQKKGLSKHKKTKKHIKNLENKNKIKYISTKNKNGEESINGLKLLVCNKTFIRSIL